MQKTTAFIIGANEGPGAGLMTLARDLGFEAVLPWAGPVIADQQAARTPLVFFLFAAVWDVQSLKPTVDAIRHGGRKLRFSPLLYFPESPSPDAIQACAAMGFDDVMTLPFTPERVSARLARQINRTMSYCETPTYFGPDRRGPNEVASGEKRNPLSRTRRYEILRTALDGTTVLRDDARAA